MPRTHFQLLVTVTLLRPDASIKLAGVMTGASQTATPLVLPLLEQKLLKTAVTVGDVSEKLQLAPRARLLTVVLPFAVPLALTETGLEQLVVI